MKKIALIIMFSLIMFTSSINTSAKISDYVIDQSNETHIGITSIQNSTSVSWQSFTPSKNNINQVELYIRNFSVESPPPGIYINIWINDDSNVITPLATGTMTGISSLSYGQSAWFSATLDLTMLTPNTLYYIIFNISYYVIDDWYGFCVDFSDPDGPYLGGRVSTDSTGDLMFRTYYDSATAALPEFPIEFISLTLSVIFIVPIFKQFKKNK